MAVQPGLCLTWLEAWKEVISRRDQYHSNDLYGKVLYHQSIITPDVAQYLTYYVSLKHKIYKMTEPHAKNFVFDTKFGQSLLSALVVSYSMIPEQRQFRSGRAVPC